MLRSGTESRTCVGLLRKMTASESTTSSFYARATRRGASSPSRCLNHWGRGKFRAFSAGSFPKGQVHPIAVELLQAHESAGGGLSQQELG